MVSVKPGGSVRTTFDPIEFLDGTHSMNLTVRESPTNRLSLATDLIR